MRDLIFTAKAAIVAGAALALASCGGGSTANNNAGNDLEANMSFEEPANDASAMEAAGNATDTAPAAADNSADEGVTGDTSGGDTGGNTVESNVSGM